MKKELCIKKALAMVLMLVFSLSCVISAPKVKAEGSKKTAAPTVTLNGATIRTDANDGNQGLRFKITVTDAANVKACGIELAKSSNAENPLDIGTANTNFQKIYKKTTEDDGSVTVEYVAAVTNIPNTELKTDIYAKGYIIKADGTKVYTAELGRNMQQVASASGNTFDETGNLTPIDRVGLKLTPTDGRGVGIIKGLNEYSLIYSNKKVHVQFDVRMQGKVADENETLDIVLDAGNGNTKILGTVTVTNDWTNVDIPDVQFPQIGQGQPCIYLKLSNENSDMSDKEFYIKKRLFEVVEPGSAYTINFDNFSSEDVHVRGAGSAEIVDANVSESESPNKYLAYTRGNGDADYAFGAYPIIKIKLPDGKTLSDYGNISFNQMGVVGDVGYKPIHVAITTSLDDAKSINSEDSCLGIAESGCGSGVWAFMSNYKLPTDNRADLNEFFLIIRTHALSSKDGALTQFAIDNIKFYEKETVK